MLSTHLVVFQKINKALKEYMYLCCSSKIFCAISTAVSRYFILPLWLLKSPSIFLPKPTNISVTFSFHRNHSNVIYQYTEAEVFSVQSVNWIFIMQHESSEPLEWGIPTANPETSQKNMMPRWPLIFSEHNSFGFPEYTASKKS